MNITPSEIIKKKRDGSELTTLEIESFVRSYTQDQLPDYQMAAFLMAVFFRGMSSRETLDLTRVMLLSGAVVDPKSIPGFKVDKHSTGGVGDKTSLILGPIVAACGVPVPMISGRGLGHTGGTLDKLESIPGFNVKLSLADFVAQVSREKICFIGQTQEICPADRKIYALRDVTATVESLPLICASILSKKFAEGIDGLVLDVKFGNGAFMKSFEQAETLALALMDISRAYGKKVTALLTDMNQPLGRFAGNALEVTECLAILKNEKNPSWADTRELSLQLAAHMLLQAGTDPDLPQALRRAESTLESGAAYDVFERLCHRQGGRLKELPRAQKSVVLRSTQEGFISGFDTEGLGYTGILLRAGRLKTEDKIHPTSGLEFHVKIGSAVRVGDPLITLWGDEPELFPAALSRLERCVTYSLQKPEAPVLIKKTFV